MIDAHTLALLCQAIYAPAGEFDAIVNNGDVVAGMRKIDGCTVITFRGSLTLRDWLNDLKAAPVYQTLVGTVHEGMWAGIEDMFDRLRLEAGDTVVLTGHSLGCAHAAYIARLSLLRGIKVQQLYLFEPPRMGYQDFIDGLRNVQDLKAWRNRNDPVTEVPITLPDVPWMQFPLIPLDVKPDGWWEGIDDIEDHAIANDVAGTALPA